MLMTISFIEFILILVLYNMETKLNTNKVVFNILNDYFKDNIRISLIFGEIFIIIENRFVLLY